MNGKKHLYHCHYTGECRGDARSKCNLKHSVPKRIPITSLNGSNYGYHFIIKGLAEKFKKQFPCLGENTDKHISSIILIEKEVTRIDKSGGEIQKKISFILELVDSARFMVSSLSDFVNYLSEGIQRIKCKY